MKVRVVVLIIALFGGVSGATAQTSRGTVSGTIADPVGASFITS